jgi:hypothetical protein
MDYYFSEKLIDAISVGCIPIYWGCPSIDQYFWWFLEWQFHDIKELNDLLDDAIQVRHDDAIACGSISENIETAKQYRMPEDWMYEHYEELFK